MRENPFKSKAQARKFFAMEARGELPAGTARRWMAETPDFSSLPERVGANPDDEEPLVIQLAYFDGPQYWNKGRLVEARTFWDADQQLETWGDEGLVGFAVYLLGELVYEGSYDLAVKPIDLRRQMVAYLEQLETEDADRLLGLLVQQNPEENPEYKKGYIDPDTGAWMSRRRFEHGLDEVQDAVVSETITEDPVTVEAINEALLAGTVGIGQSGLVTETRRRPAAPAAPPIELVERPHREPGPVPMRPRLSVERLAEVSDGHGLTGGGYAWENVRTEFVEQLFDAGITAVLEIEADTFGDEIMGSSRDAFEEDVYGLDDPVVLFTLVATPDGVDWPERLIGADETYTLRQRGYLGHYEHECGHCEGLGTIDGEECVLCEGTGMLLHEGGSWALYAIAPYVVDEDEEEEEEFDGGRLERDELITAAERVLSDLRGPIIDWSEYTAGRHQANDDRRHQGDEAMLRDLRAIQEQRRHTSFIRGYAEVILNIERAEPETEPPAQPTGMEIFGAYGQMPTVALDERLGRSRPLPWDPASSGWFLGDSLWVQYRRQERDGTPIYAVVDWGGVHPETLFAGRVDAVIPWVMENAEIGAPRAVGHGYQVREQMAMGARRISSDDPAGQTYIVDGEVDADGLAQWVNDAVGFFNEMNARSQSDDFPTDPDEKVQYLGITEDIPSREVVYRLAGPWRIEERAAIFKYRMSSSGFINRFRLFAVGEADRGQRVQLFHDSGQAGSIRDIVITTWLAGFHAGDNRATVGFRLINGDNGIEIMNGQVDVLPINWNKGRNTVLRIVGLLGVRAVFLDNGWPEEYYLNIGYADNPFVYF